MWGNCWLHLKFYTEDAWQCSPFNERIGHTTVSFFPSGENSVPQFVPTAHYLVLGIFFIKFYIYYIYIEYLLYIGIFFLFFFYYYSTSCFKNFWFSNSFHVIWNELHMRNSSYARGFVYFRLKKGNKGGCSASNSNIGQDRPI